MWKVMSDIRNPHKNNKTTEELLEGTIHRWMWRLPGGSRTGTSWHRMGMILNTGAGVCGVQSKCRLNSVKYIIRKTLDATRMSFCWWAAYCGDTPGKPGSGGLETARSCLGSVTTSWSLFVGERDQQKGSVKKASPAAVGGTDQKRKLFKLGGKLEGYWSKAGLHYGGETKEQSSEDWLSLKCHPFNPGK